MANKDTRQSISSAAPIRLVDNGDGTYSVAASITGSLTKSVKIANNVSIPANSWWNGPFTNFDGYRRVAGTGIFETSISNTVNLTFSNDGLTMHGSMSGLTQTSSNLANMDTEILTPYVNMVVKNNDTVNPHTLNAWMYGRV